jgi:succinate dehydrogenase / fumarate reductase membrane anchor subunit
MVVDAHYGLRDWLVQRITAVVMAAYTVLLLIMLLAMPTHNFATWRALFSPQWMKFATLLFVAALLWHAWVGVRSILMDYIKSDGGRLWLYVIVFAALVVYGAWAVQILWSV